MNGHETFEELAAVYAVGALDGDDLARFEAHLASGCDPCTSTLREAREALARLAAGDTPAIPPAGVKTALLARVAADSTRPQRAPSRRGSWVPWAVGTAVAAGIAALITFGAVASRYEAKLGQMARETAATRERLQQSEAALREQVAVYQGAVELLRDPATRVVDLRGAGPVPEASGRVIYNPGSGGHLFVAKLPPAPSGKAYELWTLGGPAPKPAGVFKTDERGYAMHKIPPSSPTDPAKIFAVTVEPEAGVPAPTGPIVMASR